MILAEIQCLPTPPGTPDDRHAHVEAAIAEIEHSGVTYEVGALGTTLQGDADDVWPLLRRGDENPLTPGAGPAGEGGKRCFFLNTCAGPETPFCVFRGRRFLLKKKKKIKTVFFY